MLRDLTFARGGGLGSPFNTPIPERPRPEPRALSPGGTSSPRRRRCTAADPARGVRPLGGGSAWTRFAGRARGGPKAARSPGGGEGEPGPGWHGCPLPGLEQRAFSPEDGGATKGGKPKAGSRAKGALEPTGKRPHFQGRGALSAPGTQRPAGLPPQKTRSPPAVRLLPLHEPG